MNGDTWLKTGNPWGKMNRIKIVRKDLGVCNYGFAYINGEYAFKTMELPYLSNEKWVSCIPPGLYKMGRHNGKKHKDAFYLENKNLNVSHCDDTIRRFILLHPVTVYLNLEGCIGVGMDFDYTAFGGLVGGDEAMRKLRQLITNVDEWEVEIV